MRFSDWSSDVCSSDLDRLFQSDEVLGVGGYQRVADLLGGKRDPRIVVIGGSTSAIATIALLLKSAPAVPWGPQAITLLHRRPLRPFYPTPEAAHAEGFTDFGPDDICPVPGFGHPLAGFRLEARASGKAPGRGRVCAYV